MAFTLPSMSSQSRDTWLSEMPSVRIADGLYDLGGWHDQPSRYSEGDLCEFQAYPTMTASEIAGVEASLMTKWAVSA